MCNLHVSVPDAIRWSIGVDFGKASPRDEEGQQAGRAIREARLETVAAGTLTADLGGHAGTHELTDDVTGRTRAKLEIWASL